MLIFSPFLICHPANEIPEAKGAVIDLLEYDLLKLKAEGLELEVAHLKKVIELQEATIRLLNDKPNK